jgi:hypothetical protein
VKPLMGGTIVSCAARWAPREQMETIVASGEGNMNGKALTLAELALILFAVENYVRGDVLRKNIGRKLGRRLYHSCQGYWNIRRPPSS